jgi:hypothetical protein
MTLLTTKGLDTKQQSKERKQNGRPCGKTTSLGDIILQTRFDHFLKALQKNPLLKIAGIVINLGLFPQL